MSGPGDSFGEEIAALESVQQLGSTDYLSEYTGVLADTDEQVRIIALAPALADTDAAIDAFTQVSDQWYNASANANILSIRERDTEPRPWIAVPDNGRDTLTTLQPELSADAIQTVISETADALRTLGLYNTVHGHLSPDDIYLPDATDEIENPSVQVGGFGLEAALQATVGEFTPIAYTAPELLDDPSQPNPQTDVYSLGAVAYFALTGHSPIEGTDLEVAIQAGPSAPPSEYVETVQSPLDDVILRALSTHPAHRQDSPYAFKRAFLSAFDPTAFVPLETPDDGTAATEDQSSPDDSDVASGASDAAQDEALSDSVAADDPPSDGAAADDASQDTRSADSTGNQPTADTDAADEDGSVTRRAALGTFGVGLLGIVGWFFVEGPYSSWATTTAPDATANSTPTARLTPTPSGPITPSTPTTQTPTETISEPQKISSDAGDSYDRFGQAVAMSADGTTALVGSPGDEDPNGTSGGFGGAGAAYVFSVSGGSWEQTAALAAQDGEEGDAFGTAVALSEDGTTALVGAPDNDANGTGSGAAYIFSDSGDGWSQSAKLIPLDGDSSDSFGSSVALADSTTTALVGAPNDEDPNGSGTGTTTGAGAAYVFSSSSSSWTQQAKLAADDGDANDGFGSDVSLSGDATTALVGAQNDEDPNGIGDNLGTGAGSAYTFTRTDDSWSQQAKITPENGNGDDQFGSVTALSDDGTTALVGAPYDEDVTGWAGGTAYIFTRDDRAWIQQAQLVRDDGDRYDYFGYSVALAGDGATALVGAYEDEDPNGDQAGSAYVFTNGSSWSQDTKLSAPDGDSSDRFGTAVALAADGTTALVGAYTDEDPNGSNDGSAYSGAGSAYVFYP